MTEFHSIDQQISQLIGLVAKNNEMIIEMKSEITEMKGEIVDIKVQIQKEKELDARRHEEVLKELRNQNYLINHHRDKIAKNEEDISVLMQMIKS